MPDMGTQTALTVRRGAAPLTPPETPVHSRQISASSSTLNNLTASISSADSYESLPAALQQRKRKRRPANSMQGATLNLNIGTIKLDVPTSEPKPPMVDKGMQAGPPQISKHDPKSWRGRVQKVWRMVRPFVAFLGTVALFLLERVGIGININPANWRSKRP